MRCCCTLCRYANFAQNALNGTIPEAFLSIASLMYAFLIQLHLSSVARPRMFTLKVEPCPRLRSSVDLSNNALTGTIPAQRFTSPINGSVLRCVPVLFEERYCSISFICHWSVRCVCWLGCFSTLDLSENLLTGTIPSTILTADPLM